MILPSKRLWQLTAISVLVVVGAWYATRQQPEASTIDIPSVQATTHPRMYFTSEELKNLRSFATRSNTRVLGATPRTAFRTLQTRADTYVESPYTYRQEHQCATTENCPSGSILYEYTLSATTPDYTVGGTCCQWTQMGQDIQQRLEELVLVAAVTEESTYHDAATTIMRQLAEWERWSDIANPHAGLSTYAITRAMAFGYDTLFHELSASDRATISQAILAKGIVPTKTQIEEVPSLFEVPTQNAHADAIATLGMTAAVLNDTQSTQGPIFHATFDTDINSDQSISQNNLDCTTNRCPTLTEAGNGTSAASFEQTRLQSTQSIHADALTVSAWVYSEDTDVRSWQNIATLFSVGLWIHNGQWVYWDQEVGTVNTGIEVAENTWTHVAFTRDTENDLILYVNGEPVKTAQTSREYNAPLYLGLDAYSPTSNYFKGRIDNVQIYDWALDEASITKIASGGVVAPQIATPLDEAVKLADQKIRQFISYQDQDGGLFEGTGYGNFIADKLIRMSEVYRRVGLEDPTMPYLQSIWKDPIYLTESGQHVDFNDAGSGIGWLEELAYAAGRLQHPTAAWMLQQNGYKFADALPFTFLPAVSTVQPAAPSNLEPSTVFRDMGVGVSRFDWSGQHPVLFFESGPRVRPGETGNIHGQFDNNTFALRHAGNWLVADAGYNQPETVKHSTVLVNGAGQNERYAAGEITESYRSQWLDVLVGEAGRSYDALRQFTRNIFAVKPHYYVIADSITADSKPWQSLNWLLHTDQGGDIERSQTGERVAEFTLEQPHSIATGLLTSAEPMTRLTTPQRSLSSSTQVGPTTHSPYLEATIGSARQARFLSILFPQRTRIGSLSNQGFETVAGGRGDKSYGWVLNSGSATPKLDNTTQRSGVYSLKLSSTDRGKKARIYQDTGATAGTPYQASVQVKTQNVDRAQLILYWQDAAGEWLNDTHTSEVVNGTSDWTTLTISQTVPTDAVLTRLDLVHFGGTAWFDDVTLQATDQESSIPTLTAINDQTIEISTNNWTDVVTTQQEPIQTAHGTVTCRAQFCAIGQRDADNPFARLVMYKGAGLQVDERISLDAPAGTTVSIAHDAATVDGQLSLASDGTVYLTLPGLQSITVNGQTVRRDVSNPNTVTLELPAGTHELSVNLVAELRTP